MKFIVRFLGIDKGVDDFFAVPNLRYLTSERRICQRIRLANFF